MNFKKVILFILIVFGCIIANKAFYSQLVSYTQEVEAEDTIPAEQEYIYSEIKTNWLVSTNQCFNKFFKNEFYSRYIFSIANAPAVFYLSRLFIRYSKLLI